MGRKQIKDIRREELIDAAIVAIHRHGFAAVTVNQIAKQADTSAGSIHYYFGGKEGLLEATMRRLLSILKRATLARLAEAEGPRQRLLALVIANFDDALFSPQTCSVWIQFWAYAPYDPALARLQNLNKSRVRSNLRTELRQLLPSDNAETARRAIQAYMDGAWLQRAQSTQGPDSADARRRAEEVVSLLLAATT